MPMRVHPVAFFTGSEDTGEQVALWCLLLSTLFGPSNRSVST
jgi:hypothetical protein